MTLHKQLEMMIPSLTKSNPPCEGERSAHNETPKPTHEKAFENGNMHCIDQNLPNQLILLLHIDG